MKNSIILHIIMDICPILYNDTRWSSKNNILEYFMHFRNYLLQDDNNPNSNFRINRNAGFRNIVSNMKRYFFELSYL